MRFKANIMDETQIRRTLIRMSHEIIEKNRGVDNIVFVGIYQRGYSVALELSEIISVVAGKKIPVGSLDVSSFRDNLSNVKNLPPLPSKDIPFDISNANVILVDDVIFTGRTTRAAMQALSTLSNPKTIQIAALIDRGNRELPIGANYVGKDLPSSHDELVSVNVKSIDGIWSVDIFSLND